MRKITKLRRSIRAISPVISVLLMIAIAVVASLVVYAWVMGYIGGSTNKTGMAVNIPSFATDQASGNLIVYVQNVGQGTVQLDPASAVYVNNALATISKVNGNTANGLIPIPQGQTVALLVNSPYSGGQVAIKVVTTGGAFMQITGTGSSGNGGVTLTSTTLTATLNPTTMTLGQSVTTSGSLMAGSTGVSGKTVTIAYSLNSQTVQTDSATTGTSGAYSDSYTPNSAGSWSVTASFAGDSTYALSSSTAQSLTVGSGSATTLTVSGFNNPATAGVAGSITVTAKDAYGNTATGYTGTVHFTSSDSQATLPSNYAFQASDNGVHTFTNGVTLKTVGSQSITATDTVTNSITGAQTGITVNAASGGTKFAFASIGTQTAGTAFNIVITAQDAYGNTVTTYTGNPTLTYSAGTINPTTSGNFVAGTKTVSVTVTKPGTGVTITATDGSTTGTSSTFNVNPGALNQFSFSTISSPQTSGTAFSISITAQDQYGNTVTSYSSSVPLSVSGGLTISPTSTGTSGWSSGVWTGSITLTGSGSSITITANDGNGHSGTSNTFTVNAAQAQVTFVAAGTGSGTTGNPTPAYPTGLQANDLILLQVTVNDGTTTPTTPTGWTILYGPDTVGSGGFTGRQWIYSKFSTGSETGTLTVNIGGGSAKTAGMYAFRNVATTNFVESTSFNAPTNPTSTISASSVTTTGAKELTVSFNYVMANYAIGSFTGETGGNWAQPTGAITQYSAGFTTIQLQTATMASAGTISGGTTPNYNWGGNNYAYWGIRAFALKPA